MAKLFAKKEIFKVRSNAIDPAGLGEPATADEFLRRGMAYYARGIFNAAEVDLRASIALDSAHIDAYYCLGMVLKALDKKQEATEAFSRVLQLISTSEVGKSTKNDMLSRLAVGHMNMINQGDWNLEKVIWQRST